MTAPLILASASPRRRELLAKLGFAFEVIVREVDENLPEEYPCNNAAEFLARKKALAFEDLKNDFIIVTADTVVCLEGKSLAKPADRIEAIIMLQQLSGKMHEVITGVSILHKEINFSFSENTKVFFNDLSANEINHYVDTFSPFDKAGAYGIQDWIGMAGIEKIEGDYYNVMGFPASRFRKKFFALFPENNPA